MARDDRADAARRAGPLPPAAGTRRGPDPRLAALKVPQFARLDQAELLQLLNILRDSQAVHLYLLLCAHADFKTGELLSTYARFMDLMTPPQPQAGPRRRGPTYAQLRRVLDDLEGQGLVRRDRELNAAHGQLRLFITPRDRRDQTEKGAAGRQRAGELLNELRKGQRSSDAKARRD